MYVEVRSSLVTESGGCVFMGGGSFVCVGGCSSVCMGDRSFMYGI